MKFTKTAVALAIAGIATVPTMAAAETTLSGVVQINLGAATEDVLEIDTDVLELYTDADPDNDEGDIISNTLEANSPEFSGGDVNIQLNAQQELSSGLMGYGNFRLDADSLSGGALSADSVHAGVQGGFGDIRVGEVNVVAEYGQVANDLHDQTGAVNGGISYEGGFGPVSVGLSYSPENNQDQVGVGAKFSLGGFAFGVGAEDRADAMNYSVGAAFSIAGASIAAHYVAQENGGDADDTTIIAAEVGYGIAGVNLGLTYSQADELVFGYETRIRFDAGYDLGGGLGISLRYDLFQDSVVESVPELGTDGTPTGEVIDLDDYGQWRIQLEKSF